MYKAILPTLLLLTFTGLISCAEQDTERPNILLIIADDVGISDIGVLRQRDTDATY